MLTELIAMLFPPNSRSRAALKPAVRFAQSLSHDGRGPLGALARQVLSRLSSQTGALQQARGKWIDVPDLAAIASRTDVPGIGANAVGRHVLMLVVSDLRIDPRVEREARALASAGYRVTVLCPDP